MSLDAAPVARKLGISRAAVELAFDSDLLDLHIDTFIPHRLVRYDIFERHDGGWFGGRFFGHADLPRMTEGGLTGGMWSITTNPFRPAGSRWRTFERNLARFRAMVAGSGGMLRFARTAKEYAAARAAGAHAVLLSIQGGNALVAAPDGAASVPDRLLTRVTLVHLTNSEYGASSSPLASRVRADHGLSARGRALVEQLNALRIFVDLAHIHPQSFWDAVDAHDPSQPLIDTHTGVCGVNAMWRNIDDAQIRAIADTGGVVGIMFHQGFLQPGGGPCDGSRVVDHMQHIIDVAGEDHVAIGTDYDGAVVPPTDLRSAESYPRLVQHMLDRGWSDTRIRKILGANYLRAFAALRPD
jgi:membrane dipeptidase